MTPWERAHVALRLLRENPGGLGGIWVRARSGPVRERFVKALSGLGQEPRKLHPQITDEQLFGGVDLSSTLSAGRVIWQAGILSEPGMLVLPMAERCSSGLAARLGAALDQGSGHCLVALDEGAEPDEAIPSSLADRLAFHIDLDGLGIGEAPELELNARRWAAVAMVQPVADDRALADLSAVALRLGILSLRAPLYALRVAKTYAAIEGRGSVELDDLRMATELVLAPRATRFPEEDSQESSEPEQPEAQDPADSAPDSDVETQTQDIPQEVLVEAALAALPRDLLERLASGKAPRASVGTSGSGAGQKGNRRGRPLPSRAGRLDGTARVDLIGTLRAAAPWQPLRRRQAAGTAVAAQALHIRQSDIRVKRYQEQSDRLLVFAVDASGSAAMTRLAEAKGAVELLLGEAYARRDHVALIAFRGTDAEILLPPTRSLVQTKRRLAALPGGGGTPLASGMKAAMELAVAAAGRGMTPSLALLTDGRANIALDGSAGRQQAGADAETMARAFRAASVPGVVIDMSPRPQPALKALAGEMDAPYLPMPRADAHRLSSAVSAAVEA